MTATSKVYLAVDLGASSGRVVAGLFDGQKLTLEDVHRFENGGILIGDRLKWDLPALWKNIVEGLRAANVTYGDRIASIGVDTWGVDFGLLGRNDELLGNPYHYRDVRNNGMMEEAFKTVSREEIFAETGLQFMEINSLYQLIAMQRQNNPILEMAEHYLQMPDLFNWLLTGEKSNEYTDATTTQFLNPVTKNWCKEMLAKFGIPTDMFGDVVQPGTNLGGLRQSVADQTGIANAQVILPGTHDTASAVMAVPTTSPIGGTPDWCYISSGTWSLMGTEVPNPVINAKCAELNFTNEGGVAGTTRLLKNIAGLWLIQECRRIWNLGGKHYDWDTLVQLASEAAPLTSFISPDHDDFVAPKDMPATIREFCSRTGQSAPESDGAVIRCALESLALRYRSVLGWSEELNGNRIETIHIVGGGTQNKLLSQMTADACNRRVVTGPIEATAIGNVMMQAVSLGDVADIAEARQISGQSFDSETYEPQNPGPWDEAYERFIALS